MGADSGFDCIPDSRILIKPSKSEAFPLVKLRYRFGVAFISVHSLSTLLPHSVRSSFILHGSIVCRTFVQPLVSYWMIFYLSHIGFMVISKAVALGL
jgi:hypothetical protein